MNRVSLRYNASDLVFVMETGATTNAQTQGAVRKSRWRGLVKTKTRSLSHMKDSTSILLTHTSFSTSLINSILRPKSPRRPLHNLNLLKSKPMKSKKQKKPKKTQLKLLPAHHHQAHLWTLCRKWTTMEWVHKGCLKIWCL